MAAGLRVADKFTGAEVVGGADAGPFAVAALVGDAFLRLLDGIVTVGEEEEDAKECQKVHGRQSLFGNGPNSSSESHHANVPENINKK